MTTADLDIMLKVTGVEFSEGLGNDFARVVLSRKGTTTSATLPLTAEEYRKLGSLYIGDTVNVHLTVLARATDR